MTDAPDDRLQKTALMKALSDEDRRAAIDASPNVVGYDRFTSREKQVAISQGYKSPTKPSSPA